MSPSDAPTQLLNPFRDCDSTISLGTLCQGLVTILMKKFFFVSNLNLPRHNLWQFVLVLSLVT